MVQNYGMSENMGSNNKATRHESDLEKTTNYANDDPKPMTKHYIMRSVLQCH